MRKCLQCGKEFSIKPDMWGTFCSADCMSDSYQDDLRDDEIQSDGAYPFNGDGGWEVVAPISKSAATVLLGVGENRWLANKSYVVYRGDGVEAYAVYNSNGQYHIIRTRDNVAKYYFDRNLCGC